MLPDLRGELSLGKVDAGAVVFAVSTIRQLSFAAVLRTAMAKDCWSDTAFGQ